MGDGKTSARIPRPAECQNGPRYRDRSIQVKVTFRKSLVCFYYNHAYNNYYHYYITTTTILKNDRIKPYKTLIFK